MKALLNLLEQSGVFGDGAESKISTRVSALDPAESPRLGTPPVEVYLRSLVWRDGIVFGIARLSADRTRRLFAAVGTEAQTEALRRSLEVLDVDIPTDTMGRLALADLTTRNALLLHDLFPWTRPQSLRERRTTIGMGDRLGIATPGHLRAARRFAVSPVLAQQSVRENDFIHREFNDVVGNATWGVFREGFRDGYGADGDHLKNIPAIDTALAASMPMITLDLTEVMRPEVADWDDVAVEEGFRALDGAFRSRVESDYAGRDFVIGAGKGEPITIHIEDLEAKRCAVMYGPALDFSKVVDDHLDRGTGGAYDLEISIDETSTPTLPAHHLFIARELHHRAVTVNSLAPRFIGEFQKAIDYIGDLSEFDRQFRIHCAIAREYGGYKISVHSGSDKFSVYPSVGRETDLRLHLKTSGTSWLEALETIARHDPDLYRRIHSYALAYYPTALTFYHITADFDAIVPLDERRDEDLPGYFSDANTRQMLHISYGGILSDPELHKALYDSLFDLEEEYAEALRSHFERHIGLLGAEERAPLL